MCGGKKEKNENPKNRLTNHQKYSMIEKVIFRVRRDAAFLAGDKVKDKSVSLYLIAALILLGATGLFAFTAFQGKYMFRAEPP